MEKNVVKIALTGGPCGGKTSGLARISQELSDKGYDVLIVPEAATLIKSMGVKIDEAHATVTEFEEMIINIQLYLEKMLLAHTSKIKNENIIILCDRGVCDCKAYISDEVYSNIFKNLKLDKICSRDDYDAVFHLKTVADGKEQYYTLENNTARTETAHEARIQDKKTIDAWCGHPHFRVIDNSTDFEGKLSRLMNEIYSFLGMPIPIESERKFLIKMPDLNVILSKYNAVKSDVLQVYLPPQNENEELRIRQRGQNGSYSYYLTRKITRDDMSRYELEEKISKERFLELLINADLNNNSIKKTRYCFVYNNQYFELDVYPFDKNKAILEIELTDMNTQISFPDDIEIIEEVTSNPNFKNANIAKNTDFFVNYLNN